MTVRQATLRQDTLHWSPSRVATGAVLGAWAGPASFASGVKLGGAQFVHAPCALAGLAFVWAAALPMLIWLSMHFDGVAVPQATHG